MTKSKFLSRAGEVVNLKSRWGRTALLECMSIGRSGVVEYQSVRGHIENLSAAGHGGRSQGSMGEFSEVTDGRVEM